MPTAVNNPQVELDLCREQISKLETMLDYVLRKVSDSDYDEEFNFGGDVKVWHKAFK